MKSINFKYIIQSMISGYYPGLHQPSSLITFQFTTVLSDLELNSYKPEIERLFNNFIESLEFDIQSFEPKSANNFFYFLNLPLILIKEAGYPIFFDPFIISENNKNQYSFLFPSLQRSEFVIKAVFNFTEKVINNLNIFELNLAKEFHDLILKIKLNAPKGINTLRFLNAAHDMNIPWIHLYENVFQFGWGKHRKWLDSSFTDKTPNIASALARNKIHTAYILNLSGLPTLSGYLINNEDHLLKVADILKYPLAIKPVNLDGGIGVRANLKNQDQLIKAFKNAQKFSKKIMVQQHLDGKDYRVQIYNNQAYWAIERQPFSIVGNGILTIQELINQENSNRGKGNKNDILKKVAVDEEVLELISEANFSLDTILVKDFKLILKRSANVSNGGTPIPVLDIAHEDNLNLALEAAKVIGLDLAGIDLICEDISISWKKSKMAIIEVNAQPQLAKNLPKILLGKMFKRDGRIPAVAIFGKVDDISLFKNAAQKNFLNPHWITNQTNNSLGDKKRFQKKHNLYQNGMIPVMHPECDLIILEINLNEDILELPIDQFDFLIIGDLSQEHHKNMNQTLNLLAKISKKCLAITNDSLMKDRPNIAALNHHSPDEVNLLFSDLLNQND